MTTATQSITAADHAWFSGEVRALLPSLYGAAVRLCHDRCNAEDLVAEALAKAWQKLPTLADRQAFPAWLLRILTHMIQHRAAKSRPEVESLRGDAGDFSLFERLHQPILLWWGNPEQVISAMSTRMTTVRNGSASASMAAARSRRSRPSRNSYAEVAHATPVYSCTWQVGTSAGRRG
ncbi:RNA polymerase sigma factor [Nocardioides sp. S5]|uniref:RNA polymerase sigma factor n=1 Tax=Nocardioides sp. S5 TaxID=2017486 RepID=UPI001A8C1A1C|nr:RNA polymerase sigma factor [Nocardioides sp. S5]